MALSGILHVDVEVKSSTQKFWESLRDAVTLFPKAFPHDYQKIEVLEGDGKAVGSVRHLTYAEGSPFVKVSTEKIEVVDEEKKTFTYSIIGGDMLKFYKIFKGTITLVAKEDGGSLIKWSGEFEKTSEEIPDPHAISEFAVRNFKEIDDYIINGIKV